MDNSDDYLFDDIILDDHTLAVLNEQEHNFFQNAPASFSVEREPVNKRHRTESGWAPGIGSTVHEETDDDLPEISLHGDGSYGVSSHGQFIGRSTVNLQLDRQIQQSSGPILRNNPLHVSFSENKPINAHPVRKDRNITNNADLEFESKMLSLQKKLEELRNENSTLQSSLQDALEKKMAREGEVSVLRKTMDKSHQDHKAQLLQLKAEKEKADLKQVQMQKDLKEEIERQRTLFIFKHQELESAIRRPPTTVRAKKPIREFPPSPLAMPAAMRSWNRGASQMTTSRFTEDTPMKSFIKASPTKATRDSPRRSADLPGFENAFETSTPTRSPSRRAIKGKGKVLGGAVGSTKLKSQHSVDSLELHAQPFNSEGWQYGESVSKTMIEQNQTQEEEMDVALPNGDEDAEEIDILEPIKWKAELCRIILTHSHSSTRQITLQQLLNISQPTNSTKNVFISCARILEVTANSSVSDNFDESVQTICISLISIMAVLCETQQLLTLSILFDLLTTLVLSLPAFRTILLSSRVTWKAEESVSIIDIICNAILEYLEPTKVHTYRDQLAKEALLLLESLCFKTLSVSLDALETLAGNCQVLMVLLHGSQPAWLLEKSSRLLVILSTYHSLSKVFLVENGFDDQAKDAFIELLCAHLIDLNKPAVERLKIHILIYIAQLSISHPNALLPLQASNSLIPTLVLYVSHLTTPLWEDDEQLLASSERTQTFIRALNQVTRLLHHLVFGKDPCLNLRHKLQHASHRPFNSINDIFIVTFGRLSYGDPPTWIDPERRLELEYLADIARDILEVVVDGPEGDSVWATFQTEAEEASATDEEEMEARLIGVDNQG